MRISCTLSSFNFGNFYNSFQTIEWFYIQNPHVFFYAYTKEVEMVKRHELPSNFVIIFSMGGTQDHLIDIENDRHAEVFPSMEALEEAGYTNQEQSDLLAATLPTNKIGIVVNNIPHLKKKQGQETFGTLQAARS